MRSSRWLLCLALVIVLAGCGDMFQDEYHYSEPFAYHFGGESGDATEIGNYNMLKSALVDMISRHEEHAVFRFSRYNGSVSDDLAAACLEVKTANPLGAYAVESLTADTSRIVSYYLADVRIRYQKSAGEIQSIVGTASVQEVESAVRATVADFGEALVLRAYSSQVDERYFTDLVEACYISDPVAVVAEPRLLIRSYPNEGINRIYELHLDYGAPRTRLLSMSEELSGRIDALAAELRDEAPPRSALNAALRLSELQQEGTAAGSTAYDALMRSSADSKGIALAYEALCGAMELDCMAVRGQIGDMGAEEHWWNMLLLEGAYYHVDVSRMAEDPARAFLLDDESLWGVYLWDTEAYPECTGGLRYTDLVPEEETEPLPVIQPTEGPAPTEEPEPSETPEPAQTPEPVQTPGPTEEPVPTEEPETSPEPEDGGAGPAPDPED